MPCSTGWEWQTWATIEIRHDPPGGVIELDEEGNLTGLLFAKPNANILYSTLAKGPKPNYSDQLNSTRQFLWELNRFGVTSVIDAGGGSQNFPEDYTVIGYLAKRGMVNAMENELKDVVKLLVRNRCPFRIHATYDESITRFRNVFEEVNDETPFNGIHWFFDHAETISEQNIKRVRNLKGGIAVQKRMAFQCEHFVARYGDEAATQAHRYTE